MWSGWLKQVIPPWYMIYLLKMMIWNKKLKKSKMVHTFHYFSKFPPKKLKQVRNFKILTWFANTVKLGVKDPKRIPTIDDVSHPQSGFGACKNAIVWATVYDLVCRLAKTQTAQHVLFTMFVSKLTAPQLHHLHWWLQQNAYETYRIFTESTYKYIPECI